MIGLLRTDVAWPLLAVSVTAPRITTSPAHSASDSDAGINALPPMVKPTVSVFPGSTVTGKLVPEADTWSGSTIPDASEARTMEKLPSETSVDRLARDPRLKVRSKAPPSSLPSVPLVTCTLGVSIAALSVMIDLSAQPHVDTTSSATATCRIGLGRSWVRIGRGIIARAVPFGAVLLASCGSAPHRPAPAPPPRATASAKPLHRAGSADTSIDGGATGALPRGIGSARPVVVQAASPDGSWIVYCTVPSDAPPDAGAPLLRDDGTLGGPPLRPLLALGDRERGIDAYLDSDPTGQWLLLVENGRTILLDSRSGAEIDLDARGADTRVDRAEQHARRAVAFDPAAPRVVWTERAGSKSTLVRLDLQTRAETRFDAGSGEVWRVDFAPSMEAFVVEMIGADTSGNGRIDWPVPRATTVPTGCVRHAPVATQSAWLGRGDAVVTRIVAADAPLREVPGFVALLSDGIVQREPTGRLVLLRGAARKQLADAKCNAWIYDANAQFGLLLGACVGTNPAVRTRLALWSPTGRQDFDLEVNPVGPSRPGLGSERLVPVYPGRDAAVVDLEHRSVVNLKTGDSVLATWKDRVLVLREGSLLIHDVAESREIALPGTVSPLFDLLRAQRTVVAAPLVVDLESATLLGSITGRPLAVAVDGRVLVAAGGDASATAFAVGPLVWESPGL